MQGVHTSASEAPELEKLAARWTRAIGNSAGTLGGSRHDAPVFYLRIHSRAPSVGFMQLLALEGRTFLDVGLLLDILASLFPREWRRWMWDALHQTTCQCDVQLATLASACIWLSGSSDISNAIKPDQKGGQPVYSHA